MVEQDAANLIINKILELEIEGIKLALILTGKGAERIGAMLVALSKEQNRSRGAVRLSTLMRMGSNQEIFSLPIEQLKNWAEHAKQYNIMYTVVKDHDRDGMVDIFVRPEDAPRINRVVERYGIVLTPEASIQSAEPELDNTLENFQESHQDEIDQVIDEILEEDPNEKINSEATAKFNGEEQNFDALFENESREPEMPCPTAALLNENQSENLSAENQNENMNLQNYSASFQQGSTWPLDVPKDSFNQAQLEEIQKCFDKGLSIDQVNKIAQPQFSAESMKSARNVTRPSVKLAIQKAKEHKTNSPQVIKEKTIDAAAKKISSIGKEI